MKNYEKYMKMCFKLAQKGEGKTSPNPLVGAVLVNSDGIVVAKGYHHSYGNDHAEVDCIKNYETKNKKVDYSNLTLVVNLEPCNHYGKTSPCSDMIIKKGIKRVVVGTFDPNKAHSGGIEKLKNAGIEVAENVLEDEAKRINEIFFHNVKNKKPFIAIKTATTLDGKIATKTGSSKWITSDKARKEVQKLRNKYDAILTSSTTVLKDNPSLTARGKNYKNPVRIVLDRNLKTPSSSKVYNDDGTKVYIFYSTEKKKAYPKNVEMIKVSKDTFGQLDLNEIIKILYKKGVNSVLIEAGGTLNGAFLKANLVNKIYQFIAPKILGDKNATSFTEGFSLQEIAECKNLEITSVKKFLPDIMLELDNKN